MIRKGDTVVVITGKDKGKKGKVISVSPASGKATVEGVNLSKKHVRPTKRFPQGGIVELPRPVFMSTLKIVCPHCSKPTKTGNQFVGENKKKVRYCKKCGETID